MGWGSREHGIGKGTKEYSLFSRALSPITMRFFNDHLQGVCYSLAPVDIWLPSGESRRDRIELPHCTARALCRVAGSLRSTISAQEIRSGRSLDARSAGSRASAGTVGDVLVRRHAHLPVPALEHISGLRVRARVVAQLLLRALQRSGACEQLSLAGHLALLELAARRTREVELRAAEVRDVVVRSHVLVSQRRVRAREHGRAAGVAAVVQPQVVEPTSRG